MVTVVIKWSVFKSQAPSELKISGLHMVSKALLRSPVCQKLRIKRTFFIETAVWANQIILPMKVRAGAQLTILITVITAAISFCIVFT